MEVIPAGLVKLTNIDERSVWIRSDLVTVVTELKEDLRKPVTVVWYSVNGKEASIYSYESVDSVANKLQPRFFMEHG